MALAVAAPPQLRKDQDVVVVKERLHDNIGLDSYQYNYQLSDGQQKEESAQLQVIDPKNAALVVRGSFSWVDPATNQQYTINYIADENGFRPEGAHIPTV